MRKFVSQIKTLVKPVYKILKQVYYKILDLYDFVKGKNPLVPPRSMIFIGDGDYEKTCNEFLQYFRDLGKLKPTDKVLDVGSGIGRMSVPLTKYLSQSRGGSITVFDIVSVGIDWCKENISSEFPNFHYEHADIYNKMYNSGGTEKSSEYRFNYDDNMFDFVFLTSVFTHMYTSDVENYLKEITRVLKVGGRCLITFFLLNEETEKLINSRQSSQNLIYKLDNYSFTKSKEVPENAIGFSEDFIRELFVKNSLRIIEPIHYGSWCGRKNYMSYQDIIVAQK